MFWSKPTFEDRLLGRLTFSKGVWLSSPLATPFGDAVFSLAGDKSSPGRVALEMAKSLMSNPDPFMTAAKDFLEASAEASEFSRNNGELVLDGFTIEESGSMAVEWTLSEWPDAMITVKFEGGVPCKVLLAD